MNGKTAIKMFVWRTRLTGMAILRSVDDVIAEIKQLATGEIRISTDSELTQLAESLVRYRRLNHTQAAELLVVLRDYRYPLAFCRKLSNGSRLEELKRRLEARLRLAPIKQAA